MAACLGLRNDSAFSAAESLLLGRTGRPKPMKARVSVVRATPYTATLRAPPEPSVPGWWQKNVPFLIWDRKDKENQDSLSLNTKILKYLDVRPPYPDLREGFSHILYLLSTNVGFLFPS